MQSFCQPFIHYKNCPFLQCVDYIVNCYRFGTFPKIQEFLGVRDRVASSQHYRTLSTEWILVDLLVETAAHEQAVKAVSYLDIDPAKEGIAWKELVDSRDFKAMASFDPPDKTVSDDMIAESFMLEQRFLRLRSLTVRAFVAAVHLSSPTSSSVQQQQQSANDDTATSKSQQQQQSGSHLSESPEVLVQVLKDLLASLDENADLSEKECQGCRDEQFLNPVQVGNRPHCGKATIPNFSSFSGPRPASSYPVRPLRPPPPPRPPPPAGAEGLPLPASTHHPF